MARLVRLDELAKAAKSTLIKDQMLYLDKSVSEDVKLTKKLESICFDFTKVCNERRALIEELEKMNGSVDAMQSAAFLNDIQRCDVEKATSLLIMVKETQLQTCEKVLFLRKTRDFLNGFGFGGGEGVF
nr:sugar phosphate transporter domain-containing protein [Tanacetum cinerariifolium]